MLGFIIYMLILGAVAGFIARAVVPGKDAMSVPATIVLGIVGSFVGGFIGHAFGHGGSWFRTGSILGSILGAIIALLVYRAVEGRSRTAIR